MHALEKLRTISKKNNSLVCVGLDIDPTKMPPHLIENSDQPYLEFNTAIIEATSDLVCAYKPNLAFYEALGIQGLQLLKDTLKEIPKDILIILDGKRNDIGNTAKKYAYSLFEDIGCDAVTINGYLGSDGVQPFLDYNEKISFILCRTSNPSARDIQDLPVEGRPLYMHMAECIKAWNIHQNCGAVVGATYPEELKKIRFLLGENAPLLIPGIGKQGGDLEKTVKAGVNNDGELAVINSSRGIIYASSKEDYAEAARAETKRLQEAINALR